MTVQVGLSAEVALTVGEIDTALAVGSGTVPVLATPRLIALIEQAAVHALQSALAPGQTTVGTHIDVRHSAATPQGIQVVARAALVEIAGRMLRFRVEVRDTYEVVAEGTHERAIVDQDRFLARVAMKTDSH